MDGQPYLEPATRCFNRESRINREGSNAVTALVATHRMLLYQDRVRVPGDRIGKVIGFYRRDPITVLVQFPGGVVAEFLEEDIELL